MRSNPNLELLRDKDWLHGQYITRNKSYGMIVEEFGVGKTSVARWVKRFGLHELKCTTQSGKREGEGPPVETECAECGTSISVKYCRIVENPNRFCGHKCSSVYKVKNTDIMGVLNGGLEEWRETPEAQLFMREHGARVSSERVGMETSIERKIRQLLTREGIKFEAEKKMYYWCVDFYLPDFDIVIEAQGDYWHAHPETYAEPNAMQKVNIRRDKGKSSYLTKCEHIFLALWERDINENINEVLNEINTAVSLKRHLNELAAVK